jgi:hypothetical protein
MHSPHDTPAPWRARLRQAARSLPVIGRLLRFAWRLLRLPSVAQQTAERLARVEQEAAQTAAQAAAQTHVVQARLDALLTALHSLLPQLREEFLPFREQCANDRRRLIRLAEVGCVQTRSLADCLRPLAEHLRDYGDHLQQLAGAQRLLGKPMPEEVGAVGVQVYQLSRHLLELADARLLQELGQWGAYVQDCQHGVEESLASLRRSA